MHLGERVRSIRDGDLVLDIGPGSQPYARANVALDVRWSSESEAKAQRGYAPRPSYAVPLVLYDGVNFPFRDAAFDYAICSHVLEHIPAEHLEAFLSELQRVASRGYIEYPTVFYELINFQPVHRWFMNTHDGEILMLPKDAFMSSHIHRVYRDMIYHSDGYLRGLFRHYRELFFSGFEWEGSLRHRIVGAWDDLVNSDDVARLRSYLESLPSVQGTTAKASLLRSIRRVAGAGVCRAKKLVARFRSKPGPRVHRTAIIARRDQVTLAPGVEIQEYVIIRPGRRGVTIGEGSQVNPFVVIYGGSGVHIGANVMIAPHCMLAAGNHNYRQTDKPMRCGGSLSEGPIVIEDDVWIGANCTVTDGVRIGRGAVVGANSVVTHDVGPYTIVAGTPAREIGRRHAPER